MNLLCCPVLSPQITGLPLFPGELTENESEVQSPIADPLKVNFTLPKCQKF